MPASPMCTCVYVIEAKFWDEFIHEYRMLRVANGCNNRTISTSYFSKGNSMWYECILCVNKVVIECSCVSLIFEES